MLVKKEYGVMQEHNAVSWLRGEEGTGRGMVAERIHAIIVSVFDTADFGNELLSSHHLSVDQGAIVLQSFSPIGIFLTDSTGFNGTRGNELVQGEIFNCYKRLGISLACRFDIIVHGLSSFP